MWRFLFPLESLLRFRSQGEGGVDVLFVGPGAGCAAELLHQQVSCMSIWPDGFKEDKSIELQITGCLAGVVIRSNCIMKCVASSLFYGPVKHPKLVRVNGGLKFETDDKLSWMHILRCWACNRFFL